MEEDWGAVSAYQVTSNQLQLIVERARRGSDGDRPVLVTGTMADGVTPIGGIGEVHASASPLEVRSLISTVDGEHLVVVTTCDAHELGSDVIARVAGGRIWAPNRWDTVKDMFAAKAVSRDLSRRRHLADALIEARPLSGYPPVRTGTLDTDMALAALLRAYLKMPSDLEGLDGFFQWSLSQEAANLLRGVRPDVASDIRGALADRFGAGTGAVLAILDAGERDQLVPLCLAAGLAHDPNAADNQEVKLRLSLRLGEPQVSAEDWRAAGEAAQRYVRTLDDRSVAISLLTQAELLLGELNGQHLAILSNVLPSGFTLRMERAAESLTSWDQHPQDEALEAAAVAAIESAASHDRADDQRIERMRMAARLIRRGDNALEWGNSLSDAANRYRQSGAWLDLARTDVSRGESSQTLSNLYANLTERFDSMRSIDNEAFSRFNAASDVDQEAVIGLEHVMRDVVSPIAENHPVLVLVLDGMGWPSFLQVYRSVAAVGWTWLRDPGGEADRCGVAALPTVTEISRTSLFAGRVRKGTGESESRAFRELEALVAASKPQNPPILHHKARLRDGGIDAVPTELLADIANQQQQVVAVVLNNIDERLKDVAQPPEGWDLASLDPLAWLLNAANEAGRVVIMTADHGHILDRNAEQVTTPGGGERWKPRELGVDDGEVEVAGRRVVGPSGEAGDAVILPFVEQRFYGVRKNGYHGGYTPQELLVPVAVLSASDQLEGWQPVPFSPPAWWYRSASEKPPSVPLLTAPRKQPTSAAPTLFDEIERDERIPWEKGVVAALEPFWTPQIRLTPEEAEVLLRVLAESGGMATHQTRLAELSGLPQARIGRFVSQLQQLVNVDGYGVITVVNGEVRLDRPLLERQLGLS